MFHQGLPGGGGRSALDTEVVFVWDPANPLAGFSDNPRLDQRQTARAEEMARKTAIAQQSADKKKEMGVQPWRQQWGADPSRDFNLGTLDSFWSKMGQLSLGTNIIFNEQAVSFGPPPRRRGRIPSVLQKLPSTLPGQILFPGLPSYQEEMYTNLEKEWDLPHGIEYEPPYENINDQLISNPPETVTVRTFNMSGEGFDCMFHAIAFCLNAMCYQADVIKGLDKCKDKPFKAANLRQESSETVLKKWANGQWIVSDVIMEQLITSYDNEVSKTFPINPSIDETATNKQPIAWIHRARYAIETCAEPSKILELLTDQQVDELYKIYIERAEDFNRGPNSSQNINRNYKVNLIVQEVNRNAAVMGDNGVANIITNYMFPGLSIVFLAYEKGTRYPKDVPPENNKITIQRVTDHRKEGRVEVMNGALMPGEYMSLNENMITIAILNVGLHYKAVGVEYINPAANERFKSVRSLFYARKSTEPSSLLFRWALTNLFYNNNRAQPWTPPPQELTISKTGKEARKELQTTTQTSDKSKRRRKEVPSTTTAVAAAIIQEQPPSLTPQPEIPVGEMEVVEGSPPVLEEEEGKLVERRSKRAFTLPGSEVAHPPFQSISRLNP